ncbi:retrovirus-related pol polyprotein from transposon TNT 1-94 [Tanacetum coccineum]
MSQGRQIGDRVNKHGRAGTAGYGGAFVQSPGNANPGIRHYAIDEDVDEQPHQFRILALIVEMGFSYVFHVAMNSELNVSSFTEMHDAHTSLKARCLELEVELFNLRDKIQKDNHDELIKWFSNIGYSHYKSADESLNSREKDNAIQKGKYNAIKKLRMKISQLKETCSEADRTLDFRTLDFQITQLTKKINVLQEQNELFRAKNGKIKQHYKELYDSIKITRAKHLEQTTALLTKNESLKVQIQNKLSCVNKDHVKPKVLAPGKYAIDVEPIPPHNRNNREVHLVYLKHLKESVETLREIVEEAKVERPLLHQLAVTPNTLRNFSRTPQQNGIVERQNHTLVEAARTMLIFSKALMFVWEEVVATAYCTQNRSLIHTRHCITPYELVHDKKPDLTFFKVFDALCYPTNDSEDLEKLLPTADIGIFIGYAPSRKGYSIYNKRTRHIMETIHVQFDELTEQMALVQLSTGPTPTFLTPGQISLGLVQNLVLAAPYVPRTNKELEILFQPMFDEYMELPRVERLVSPAPAVQVPFNSTGTPSSTTIDQDAPSLSLTPPNLFCSGTNSLGVKS